MTTLIQQEDRESMTKLKRKITSVPKRNSKAKPMNYHALVKAIESTHREMRGRAVTAVNQTLVLRNWFIGAYIVEYEQGGTDRAKYGVRLLERLAQDLAARQMKGLDQRGLRDCRLFYRLYPQIRGSLPPEFMALPGSIPIRGSVTPELGTGKASSISATLSRKYSDSFPPALSLERLSSLSWTHFIELLRIDDAWKRAFYENECLAGNWSARQLQRQIETLLYERTGLSKNKKVVIERGRNQAAKAPRESIDDLIRDPYVLEFAGLVERQAYSETDLETALLNHLQRFLLELGTGFCFEARQFRITINDKHNRVDLVFYNRRLRCHLLIDLKVRAFRHADAGQMNFYLNWFKAHMIDKDDNPPVGILLCSDKDHTEVEYATAGMDNKLFVSRYLTALPSAEQLKALVESDRARLEKPVFGKRNMNL